MKCRICSEKSTLLFKAKVLNKHDVSYYRCSSCGFIQTEDPYWLPEAYSSAITKLDIGLLQRNQSLLPITSFLINKLFDRNGKFVDFGGGYGAFTRMMRDRGYDFYRQDFFCDNIFAKHFDVTDLPTETKYSLLTAFEVFEHLVDPVKEVDAMLGYSNSIFFSTEIAPDAITSVNDWWYFIPTTGQHTSLYSLESLNKLASQKGLNFYTNKKNLHLFTKEKINPLVFKMVTSPRIAKYATLLSRGKSFLDQDFQKVQAIDKE